MSITAGRGVDLDVDHVGGDGFTALFAMLAKWGTVVSYNASGGLPQRNVLGALREHGARCPGIRIFEMHVYDDDAANRRRTMQCAIDVWARGEVRPAVYARLPMERVADAHRIVEGCLRSYQKRSATS
jgi:NADPH2:quinone reductase